MFLFIYKIDNQVDIVAGYTALIIAILGCLASQINGGEIAFGIIFNIATFIGGLFVIFYVLSGFKFIQILLKN